VPVDHYVRFRSEEIIAEVAAKYRGAADTSRPYFNIVRYFDGLIAARRETRDPIILDKYSRDYRDPSSHASVTFRPFTLHVADDIWNDGDRDDPFSRFVLAHELGHIALHGYDEHGYSSDPTCRISFAEKGHSAEWQADSFAVHFLMPDHLVRKLRTPDVLEAACMVPLHWARKRVEMVNSQKKVLTSYFTGDCCTECGNFTIVPNGTGTKCSTCGFVVSV
jgi:IrrE N-terminal-like domain